MKEVQKVNGNEYHYYLKHPRKLNRKRNYMRSGLF